MPSFKEVAGALLLGIITVALLTPEAPRQRATRPRKFPQRLSRPPPPRLAFRGTAETLQQGNLPSQLIDSMAVDNANDVSENINNIDIIKESPESQNTDEEVESGELEAAPGVPSQRVEELFVLQDESEQLEVETLLPGEASSLILSQRASSSRPSSLRPSPTSQSSRENPCNTDEAKAQAENRITLNEESFASIFSAADAIRLAKISRKRCIFCASDINTEKQRLKERKIRREIQEKPSRNIFLESNCLGISDPISLDVISITDNPACIYGQCYAKGPLIKNISTFNNMLIPHTGENFSVADIARIENLGWF